MSDILDLSNYKPDEIPELLRHDSEILTALICRERPSSAPEFRPASPPPQPASSNAATLASGVPLPPETIAPVWPIRFPRGAVRPEMNATTGLSIFSLMNAAAASSSSRPISPMTTTQPPVTAELATMEQVSYCLGQDGRL